MKPPGTARGRALRSAIGALLVAITGASPAAQDGPEADRERMVNFFSERFPGVPLQDYVYGAMIVSADARAQYEQIMEFPPFLGDLDA